MLAEHGSYMADDWVVDAKGNVVTRAEYDDHAHRWSLELWDDKKGWKEVYGVDATLDVPSIQGLAPNGKSVYVAAIENGADVSKQIQLDTGAMAPAPEDIGLVQASPLVDPGTNQIIGTQARSRTGSTVCSIRWISRPGPASWRGSPAKACSSSAGAPTASASWCWSAASRTATPTSCSTATPAR
ncbi:MAG TPA: hypothetical protein VHZ78_00545 [Rhizomicrobium sp.]|jgi:hypothetical protein|nr:hypothetical protein [Rhizomicrobium sp.]